MPTRVQDSSIQKASSVSEKNIIAAKKFKFKDPERPTEDTLVLRTDNKYFLITPFGLFKTTNNDTIHLKTDLTVVRAYLYEDDKYYFLFFTDTDQEGATSWIQKISKNPWKSEYIEQIQGFNLGQPVINGQFAYVTAIGFVGKIDLRTGNYVWRHFNLYDNEKYSFNSFDTILVNQKQIEFISKNYKSKKVEKVIVDNQTGEIKELIK